MTKISYEDCEIDEGVTAEQYRQALWDVYQILGFDADGDVTPRAVRGLMDVVVTAAELTRERMDKTEKQLLELPRTKGDSA